MSRGQLVDIAILIATAVILAVVVLLAAQVGYPRL